MNIKNTLKSLANLLLIALIFMLLFMLPTFFIPVSEALMKSMDPNEMKLFFPLLMLFSMFIAVTYYLLINNTEQKRGILFIQLLLAHFIMYPLMGLLESLFWGDAFKGVDMNEFVKIFLRFVLTFSLFSGFLALLVKARTPDLAHAEQKESIKQVGIKILLIAVAYLIIYNLFGYFIAWQFEATRVFYTGKAEQIGFFRSMAENFSSPSFVLVHTFRGLLFGIAAYLFNKMLSCSINKKIIILSMIFGGFGFQIILPNPLFPEMVRIAHFIETTSSMLLFGALTGLILNKKMNFRFPTFLMILLLVSSCQKEPDIRFGFDADFGKDSHGLTMMNVVNSTQTINLKGTITVSEGEIYIELINPDDVTVFERQVLSPESLDVNESFQAIEGNWKLRYTSIDGMGSIALHLSPYK